MSRRPPTPVAPLRTAVRAASRVREALVATSWWAGWAGIVALAGIGGLALVDEASRPVSLPDDVLPTAAVAALISASLLGWGCMERGEERLRRLVGRPVALIVFVVLPFAATALGFAEERTWIDLAAWPSGNIVAAGVRWVPPVLVTLSLLAFLTWRARPRGRLRWGRGAWWTLLVLPYAALFALVVLHVPAPDDVRGPVTDSLASLGRSSLALQLAIGYFVGDAASG